METKPVNIKKMEGFRLLKEFLVRLQYRAEEAMVLLALRDGPKSWDELETMTGLSQSKLVGVVGELEVRGEVASAGSGKVALTFWGGTAANGWAEFHKQSVFLTYATGEERKEIAKVCEREKCVIVECR